MRLSLAPQWPGGQLPRETRDTWFLLGVIGWIALLQAPYVPLWCTALTLGVLTWRAWLAGRQKALPGWPWRALLLGTALTATWFSHKTLLGQDAGVTLIVLLLALKTLELRARRDAFVVFFLGFFTLLTHFFHSQSLLTALGIVLALLGLLSALVNAHMPVEPVTATSIDRTELAAKNRKVAGRAVLFVLFMIGLAYASVPLYRIFCQVTGFGGTPMRADAAPGAQSKSIQLKYEGDASIERGMPWEFRPAQREMTVRIGENVLAYYIAHNPTDRPVAGTASFNVTPLAAGGFFQKIACFCFTEQVLQPGETVEMPVSFFVDPEMLDHPEGKHIEEITLSYTFYETPLPEEQATLAVPAGQQVN